MSVATDSKQEGVARWEQLLQWVVDEISTFPTEHQKRLGVGESGLITRGVVLEALADENPRLFHGISSRRGQVGANEWSTFAERVRSNKLMNIPLPSVTNN